MVENKKVYIPSIEELEEMQKILAIKDSYYIRNLYGYCLAKKNEYIIANGGLEYFSNEEKCDIDVVKGVIKYTPEDLWCTPYADDYEIASSIINKDYPNNQNIPGLEYLTSISSRLYKNPRFVSEVIAKLNKVLRENPNYRFTYQDNCLLNDIFGKNLTTDMVIKLVLDGGYYNILRVEPAYITDIPGSVMVDKDFTYDENKINQKRADVLRQELNMYISRFTDGIEKNVPNKCFDITKSDDKKCKKLVKFLMNNR